MIKIHNQQGFTLVELLMAMAAFSFVLILITTGFVLVNRAYSKGLATKLVQDEGRGLMEDITREIRSTSEINDITADCFYLNGYRYYWNKPFKTINTPPYKLFRDQETSCTSLPSGLPGDPDPADAELILNEQVGVQYIELSSIGGSSYNLTIVLSTVDATGADIVQDSGGEDAICKNTIGSQYCDTVKYTTVVHSR